MSEMILGNGGEWIWGDLVAHSNEWKEVAFSDLKNDSLFQKIDLNLTTDFNHS